jgi:preprotein translocase subunit SecE
MTDGKDSTPVKIKKAKEQAREAAPAQKIKKPSKIKKFFQEIKVEFKSTSWPNKKVLFSTAGVVAVLLGVMGVYFGLLDFAFSSLTKYLLVLLGIE